MNSKIAYYIPLIVSALLIVACFPLSSGYYTFLRIVVFSVAVAMIFLPQLEEINYRNITNGIAAILFNPIFPIYLHSKTAWVVIDLLFAAWFAFQFFIAKQHNSTNKNSGI